LRNTPAERREHLHGEIGFIFVGSLRPGVEVLEVPGARRTWQHRVGTPEAVISELGRPCGPDRQHVVDLIEGLPAEGEPLALYARAASSTEAARYLAESHRYHAPRASAPAAKPAKPTASMVIRILSRKRFVRMVEASS